MAPRKRWPSLRQIRQHASASLLLAIIAASMGVVSVEAGDVASPSQWPNAPDAAPEIETWSNGIRFAGANREQTALAMALGLHGAGDYPFDTTDPSSSSASTLAQADDWWGVGTCPRAVIVVAGDTPADSLAASSLSDPTDNSSEPFLQRSAAADPLFDPIGGFARVDTEVAPILVTRSARQGATALGASARIAARDLRSGGCSLARQAIIVGGPAAVPEGVDDELVALGYDEVFRVAEARTGTQPRPPSPMLSARARSLIRARVVTTPPSTTAPLVWATTPTPRSKSVTSKRVVCLAAPWWSPKV